MLNSVEEYRFRELNTAAEKEKSIQHKALIFRPISKWLLVEFLWKTISLSKRVSHWFRNYMDNTRNETVEFA